MVNYRQQKIQQLQADKDYEVIRRKAELHYAEYREMREQQLEKGRRINALYRTKRTKEVIENNQGPQLCIVVKGSLSFTYLFSLIVTAQLRVQMVMTGRFFLYSVYIDLLSEYN